MTEHAKLSASGAHRWRTCTASYQMEKDLPDETSSYAERGTYLHGIAYKLLTGASVSMVDLDSLELEAVESYVDYINDLGGARFLEQKVDFSDYVPGGFGTADAIVVKGDHITVVDLKCGRGVEVIAENNEQLALYALGALKRFPQASNFTLVVHQAIKDNVSTWEVDAIQLAVLGGQFRVKAEEALGDKPQFNPTEKACKFCKAKGHCSALRDKVLEGFTDNFAETHTISDDELSKDLARANLIEQWLLAIKEEVRDRLHQGREIEGYMLAEGKRQRSWHDEAEIEAFLRKKKIRVRDMYTKSFISPAQAERLLKNKHININDFIRITAGRPRVVEAKHNTKAYKDVVLEGFAKTA